MPSVWTCCCAGARSITAGGSGDEKPRSIAPRMPVTSSPNAASEFAWQHKRLPTTGTS
jgi:hypothetical protein